MSLKTLVSADLSTLVRKTIVARFYHNFHFGSVSSLLTFEQMESFHCSFKLYASSLLCPISNGEGLSRLASSFWSVFIVFAMPAFLVSTPFLPLPSGHLLLYIDYIWLNANIGHAYLSGSYMAVLYCHFCKMTFLQFIIFAVSIP